MHTLFLQCTLSVKTAPMQIQYQEIKLYWGMPQTILLSNSMHHCTNLQQDLSTLSIIGLLYAWNMYFNPAWQM